MNSVILLIINYVNIDILNSMPIFLQPSWQQEMAENGARGHWKMARGHRKHFLCPLAIFQCPLASFSAVSCLREGCDNRFTVSQIRKKIPFWNYFFHFLPSKTCNSGVARLKCYWLIGMKIMKFIYCYWTQWCSKIISLVLLAPSSVEIFNFWTRRAWRLKFSQIDVLMSTPLCENFSLHSLLVQKLKISTLDGAKSTKDIIFERHWVQ